MRAQLRLAVEPRANSVALTTQDEAAINLPVVLTPKSITIIAVSYAPSEEQQKARAAGCNDFVPKPYSPHQLLVKIRQYMPR